MFDAVGGLVQQGQTLALRQGLIVRMTDSRRERRGRLISGDLNSDADFGNGPDATPSVGLIEAAGYQDEWKLVNPFDPGPTWPLFLQSPPSAQKIDSYSFHRIAPCSAGFQGK